MLKIIFILLILDDINWFPLHKAMFLQNTKKNEDLNNIALSKNTVEE
jgi:hypothetical protein